MKKIIAIFILSVFLMNCKKKKEAEADPTPVVVTAPPAPPEFSVKVDGRDFSCSTCSSSYMSGGLRGVYFGDQNTEKELFQFFFDTRPLVGIYKLTKDGNPSMNYVKAFTYYKVAVGSLTISAVDTSAGGSIKKLTGAFTAQTDSTYVNYPTYKLTQGVINLNYQ